MNLINAMLSHVIDDPRWEEFINELERLNVRKAVIVSTRLLPRALSLTAKRHSASCPSQRSRS